MACVQTLSRLNRTTAGKEETFVLDFENTAEDIEKGFQLFYGRVTLSKETDANQLNNIRADLDKFAETGSGNQFQSNIALTRAYNPRNQLTHQWGPATYPLRHLYDSFGVMSGLHTWRAGDPGAWNSETIPAAFSSASPDVTMTCNPSLGPSSATCCGPPFAQGSRIGLRCGVGCSSRPGSVNPIGSPGRFALPFSIREFRPIRGSLCCLFG